MDKDSIHKCWAQVQEGNSAAFRAIYLHTVEGAGNQAYRIVKDKEIAKDILQETYASLFSNRYNIKANNITGYINTIVKNKSLNSLKVLLQNKEESYESMEALVVVDEQDNKEATELMLQQIETVLQELPDKCRSVFELKYYRQFTYKQIAEHSGISVKTVEKHMSRAIFSLRQKVKKEGVTSFLWFFF